MSENNEHHALSSEAKEQVRNNDATQGSGFNGEFCRLKAIFREKLSKPMPPEAIQKHPSKSFLNTIKAIYIIERLNDVFGIGGWDFEHEVIGEFDNTVGDTVFKQVVVRGRIYIREFDLYTPVQYGGKNLDGKGQEPVDGFKSAVTDALTKCASFLEIGIQVFKGAPNSQQGNKSKRLDPSPVSPLSQEEVKKEIEEAEKAVAEVCDTEEDTTPEHDPMVELREKHKEVFGKYPNKNWSAETVQQRIDEKLAEGNDQAAEESTPPAPSEDSDSAPTDTEPSPSPMSPNEDFDSQAQPSYLPLNEPEEQPVEEVEAEEVVDKYTSFIDKVDSYLDATSLKNEAADIIFDAQIEGIDEDGIKSLKAHINETYMKLKPQEDEQ